jgi:hypothetical protein
MHWKGLFAGWPDWENFRLLGDCFLWAVSLKRRQNVWLLFSW